MLTVLTGDALKQLRTLPDEIVQCCVTSPPYWGLRDYGTAEWEGGEEGCDHAEPPRGGRNPETAGKQLTNGGTLAYQFAHTCGKCGARRIDSQLGLEKTPEEYVANMVEVFREVRRVLRKDGTLWLNLGDSFAANGISGLAVKGESSTLVGTANSARTAQRKTVPRGLKPKDLIGIPWRVAFALQQPWEEHIIAAVTDRAWMAGLVDGEGCLCSIAIQPTTGINPSHSGRLQVRMADTEAVERIVAITGCNSVTYDQHPPSYIENGQRPAQQWKIAGDKMAAIVADIYPFLTVKRKQAVVAWNLQRLKDGIVTKRGQPIPEENMVKRRLLHEVLGKLNQREPVDIPSWCIEPKFKTEPGWYLRSDVIWAKPNPMPESVTDRPTKAHEYFFLLTKSANYFYDAEAIKEQLQTEPHAPGNVKLDGNGFSSGGNITDKQAIWGVSGNRNKRSVWTVATANYPEAHFATYPPDLIKPCILAGTSAKGCCAKCGAPWERIVEREYKGSANLDYKDNGAGRGARSHSGGDSWHRWKEEHPDKTVGWQPTCKCESDIHPCTVLDPFSGSGTTGMVALELGRKAVLIELNPKYVKLIDQRCNVTMGLGLI